MQRAAPGDDPTNPAEEELLSSGDAPQDDDAHSAEEYHLEDDEYDPSEQEVLEYCEWLGMDIEREKPLSWIAREALKAPLPEYWKICYTDEREVYYFNMRTGESIWDHPMDAFYKALFKQEKQKLDKKRQKMRLFPGSMPIVPLQNLFIELSSDPTGGVDVPEALCDPIDFMLLVDPVVLPTSGRTVSKHTIVNNKWRDPFTREYVENRRLISNVDKRHEVGAWLATAMKAYFKDVSFPEEWVEWGAKQDSLALPAGRRSASAQKGAAVPAVPLPSVEETWPQVQRVLPYILDKEDEVCLDAQRMVLRFVRTAYALPCRARGREGLRRIAEARAAARQSGGCANDMCDVVAGLADPAEVLRPLLTMSTSASLEALCLVLSHHAPLRTHACFAGFDTHVLHVLQLSEGDLTAMCQSLPTTTFPPQTSNTDHLLKLKWCYLIHDTPGELHVLSRIPWDLSFTALATAYHCLPESPQMAYLTIKLLRGLPGWPNNAKVCEPDAIRWMVQLAVGTGDPLQQVLLLYDLLHCCGDVAAPACRKHRSHILTQVLGLAREARTPPATTSSPAGSASRAARATQEAAAAADPTPADTPGTPSNASPRRTAGVDTSYSALLGSLLVFHDVCRLDDFASDPELQMRVANGVVPRLTRVQWRPRHFEATVNTIVSALQQHPLLGWRVFKSERVDFLLRELLKKRKTNEELRLRLEAIEAEDKRLQQSAAINNWLLMCSQLSGTKGSGGRVARRREDLIQQRVENLVAVLRTLLAVRLKQKPRDARGGGGGGGDPAKRGHVLDRDTHRDAPPRSGKSLAHAAEVAPPSVSLPPI